MLVGNRSQAYPSENSAWPTRVISPGNAWDFTPSPHRWPRSMTDMWVWQSGPSSWVRRTCGIILTPELPVGSGKGWMLIEHAPLPGFFSDPILHSPLLYRFLLWAFSQWNIYIIISICVLFLGNPTQDSHLTFNLSKQRWSPLCYCLWICENSGGWITIQADPFIFNYRHTSHSHTLLYCTSQ